MTFYLFLIDYHEEQTAQRLFSFYKIDIIGNHTDLYTETVRFVNRLKQKDSVENGGICKHSWKQNLVLIISSHYGRRVTFHVNCNGKSPLLGFLLLRWFNFNPSLDMQLHPL